MAAPKKTESEAEQVATAKAALEEALGRAKRGELAAGDDSVRASFAYVLVRLDALEARVKALEGA